MTARALTAACLAGMLVCASAPPSAAQRAAALTASRVDTFAVAMPQLSGRERTVRVYLPPGYDGGTTRYPVIYLQDAQNLFTPGMFGDWRVDETIDRMTGSGETPGMIVVGVDNGPRRWDEYGPWTNPRMMAWVDSTWSRRTEGGEGDAYLAFLVHTLKPQIDRRYRTIPDRAHTAVGGSSMGGLIALWAGLTHPEVFSKVMAMSPAVWFAEGGGAWMADNRLLGWMRAHPLPADVRFYLDVGTAERSRAIDPDVVDASGTRLTYPRAYLEGTRAAAAALRAGGVPDANVREVEDAGAAHGEAAWAHRLEGALAWLFR